MRYVVGSLKELEGKVTLNNRPLTYQNLVILSTLLEGDVFQKVGTIKREGVVGRPTVIWSIDLEGVASVGKAVDTVTTVATVPPYTDTVLPKVA